MRFARYGQPGAEVPVLVGETDHFDLRPITNDLDGSFWQDGPARVKQALEAGTLPRLSVAGQRVGAPVARPGAVICIGMNYAAHAAESGSEPPTEPVIFLKHPNTVQGPDDDVPLPAHAHKLDWEVELALVIGRPCWNLGSDEEGLAAIAGVTIADDLSERSWQIERSGGQWSKGKCAPGSTPLGPELVTCDEVDLDDLRLTSHVNDEPRQDSTTADLIFGAGAIVRELSQFMRLDPGDVVLTGTPEGVALSGRFDYLTDGDVVLLAIVGLGTQTHRITAM